MRMAAKRALQTRRIGQIVELLMTALAVVFLVLLIAQYTMDLSPRATRRVNLAMTLIWAAFGIDFFGRLAFAPSKVQFLRHNWIAAVALVIPFLRVLRIFTVARATPTVEISGIVSGGKRGTDWLHRTLGLHPALYIGLLTLFLMSLSSAGMYAIEHTHPDANIRTLGDSIWWTTSTLTTIGGELYPVSSEGRMLAIFVMIYSLGFAGYVAGSFAAVLLGAGQPVPASPPADAQVLQSLRDEIQQLREQLNGQPSMPPSATETPANGVPEDATHPAGATLLR
ncbi:MAG: potassium channel family protein [Dehalococcoidia bacterium]